MSAKGRHFDEDEGEGDQSHGQSDEVYSSERKTSNIRETKLQMKLR
jgi:hypothetical protein